ncbi:unnamed protein product [Prunus brigantina]
MKNFFDLFARMTEIKNSTTVEVEIREVERGDISEGRLVAKMPPAGRKLIRGKKFLDHSSYTGVPRTVHVIATANGTRTTTVLPAQYFNTNGRVTFLLENGKLVAAAETIPQKSIIMRGIGRLSHSSGFAENRLEFVDMGFKLVNFVLDKIYSISWLLFRQVQISREEAQPTVRVEVIKVADDELMSIKPLKIFRIGGGRHITRGNYRKNRGEPDCIDSFDRLFGRRRSCRSRGRYSWRGGKWIEGC